MATTTKSTKAKTKTSKSSAAKTRTAAAKTTRASKSTKATKSNVTKAAAVTKAKATVVTVGTLRKLHLVNAFVMAALAVAAGFLMTNASYAVNVGYQAKDELISLTTGKTAFVHASQTVLDVQVRWLLIIILGLSAVFSLMAATRGRKMYQAGVEDEVLPVRWICLGIISALMVEVIALLSGVSDIFTLKLVAGLVLVTTALGWVSEKRNKQAGRPVWSEFNVSLFTGVLPWLLIGSYAVSTWVYGLVRYPWFVYALIASTIIGFSLIAANQYKRIGGWKNYLVVERNYIVFALITQAAFAAILILAFQK
jgi:hypothetical protein